MRLFTNPQHKGWMRTQPKRMSSGAMILENDAHELLVVKANYKNYWTLPGGIVNSNETPKQAAIRETSEEVGIILDAADVSFVAIVNRISDEAQTFQFVFGAYLPAVAAEKIILQKSEIDECTVVTRAQVLSGDRRYAKAVLNWANGITGYIEQTFNEGKLA